MFALRPPVPEILEQSVVNIMESARQVFSLKRAILRKTSLLHARCAISLQSDRRINPI